MSRTTPSPSRGRLFGATFLWLFGLLYGILIIFVATAVITNKTSVGILIILLVVVGLLAIIVECGILGMKIWREYDTVQLLHQWRKRAALGLMPELLASQQPIPDPHALPLPSRIRLQVTPLIWIIVIGLVIVIVSTLAAFISNELYGLFAFTWQPNIFRDLLGLLAYYLLFMALPVFYAYLFLRGPRFNVSEEKITCNIRGAYHSVRWRDISFVCISYYPSTGKRKGIELSSERDTAHILWPQPDERIYRPMVSYEEYDRQMEALLSLIAAKTGLPLFDLRIADETQAE
jgi:hypothetical protein